HTAGTMLRHAVPAADAGLPVNYRTGSGDLARPRTVAPLQKQRLHLTAAALLVSRDSKSLQATPVRELGLEAPQEIWMTLATNFLRTIKAILRRKLVA